jgi:hypothetical protein
MTVWMIERFPGCSSPLPLPPLPLHLTLLSSFFQSPFCGWAATFVPAMPESSQPRAHSNLSQMTRVDPSDGPESDNMVESPYYENTQTVSIPTKSGTEVAIRSHHQSDDRPWTGGCSSRPSSRGGEIDHEDAELLQKCAVTPSTREFNLSTFPLIKKPLTEAELEPRFTFRKIPINAPSSSQPKQSTQSSQAVPPNSFEKSNQEHQVSARSAHQEPSPAPVPNGLERMLSWLRFWLTLNITAPVDSQKDVQPQRSLSFQDSSGAPTAQKASSNLRGRSITPQSSDRQYVQGTKQPRRKKYVLPWHLITRIH